MVDLVDEVSWSAFFLEMKKKTKSKQISISSTPVTIFKIYVGLCVVNLKRIH